MAYLPCLSRDSSGGTGKKKREGYARTDGTSAWERLAGESFGVAEQREHAPKTPAGARGPFQRRRDLESDLAGYSTQKSHFCRRGWSVRKCRPCRGPSWGWEPRAESCSVDCERNRDDGSKAEANHNEDLGTVNGRDLGLLRRRTGEDSLLVAVLRPRNATLVVFGDQAR